MVLRGVYMFIDQRQLGNFEMWCCRMIEKIRWTDHVRNEEILLRVKEQRNILHEISKRNRCCHFKHVSLKQSRFYHCQTSTAHR
jgi:hypothetical protein